MRAVWAVCAFASAAPIGYPAYYIFGPGIDNVLRMKARRLANITLSFEEPHAEMLLLSTVLLVAAPAGLLVHLLAAYFDASERRRATRLLDTTDGHRP